MTIRAILTLDDGDLYLGMCVKVMQQPKYTSLWTVGCVVRLIQLRRSCYA